AAKMIRTVTRPTKRRDCVSWSGQTFVEGVRLPGPAWVAGGCRPRTGRVPSTGCSLWGGLSRLHQTCFVGEDHCLHPVSLVQLHQDVGDVRLHGRVAYDQLRGDLGIREAACEELQDV